jgi:hypothetical protein
LNNGDGTFQSGVFYNTDGAITALAVADLNEDGVPDVAAAFYYGNYFTVFLGTGDGSFTASSQVYGTGLKPLGITAGDFDGDGHPDVAVASNGLTDVGGFVVIFPGNGTGAFRSRVGYYSGAYFIRTVIAADLNGDARLDLATTGTPAVSVLLNKNSSH